MDSPEFTLAISLLAIPFAIWLQIWVRQRKTRRRNESGEEEFASVGATFGSVLIEGLAIVMSLILVIRAMGGIVTYVVHTFG